MKKRVLSVLLVLAMTLALATPVFATNDWEGEMDVVGAAVVNGTSYGTVQEAVDAAGGGVVKLLANSEEEVTAADLYLDLNGYSLKKVTVTGTLYGMDSATNEYEASGAKIETVSGTYASHYRNESDAKRYLAIAEGEGVSFHRFYMGITKLSLAPAVTGFGYKAEFYGDEAVQAQIKSVGYKLWLTENAVATRTTDFKNTVTLRLKNFDVENYGEIAVNASVMITLVNGEVIESLPTAMSMRDMMEAINADYTKYDVDQLTAVKTMIENNPIIKDWDTANLYA